MVGFYVPNIDSPQDSSAYSYLVDFPYGLAHSQPEADIQVGAIRSDEAIKVGPYDFSRLNSYPGPNVSYHFANHVATGDVARFVQQVDTTQELPELQLVIPNWIEIRSLRETILLNFIRYGLGDPHLRRYKVARQLSMAKRAPEKWTQWVALNRHVQKLAFLRYKEQDGQELSPSEKKQLDFYSTYLPGRWSFFVRQNYENLFLDSMAARGVESLWLSARDPQFGKNLLNRLDEVLREVQVPQEQVEALGDPTQKPTDERYYSLLYHYYYPTLWNSIGDATLELLNRTSDLKKQRFVLTQFQFNQVLGRAIEHNLEAKTTRL